MNASSPATLDASFRACHDITRRHARSFHFASHTLPPLKRQAAYALYTFCRYADDLLDEPVDVRRTAPALPTSPMSAHASGTGVPPPSADPEAHLSGLLDQLYAGPEPSVPFGPAFHHVVHVFDIPQAPWRDLIRGVVMDRQPLQLRTWAELERYCYHVASVVGLVLCPVLGLNRPEAARHAEELGMAMQLTNILRDVDEDLRRGRRYLPLEELQRFGVGLEDVEGRRVTPEWERFMEFQIERARGYYRSSEKGICCLEPDGSQLTVWLMRHVYAGILDGIERRRYDVFRGRVSVSLPRKLTLAVRAWRDSRRTRDMTGC